MAAIVVFMSLQVFTRYVLNDPTGWTDEASSAALVYLTFLGVPLVAQRGEGLRFEFLRKRLIRTGWGRAIDRGIKVLEIIFILVAILYSFPLMYDLRHQYTSALQIAKSWVALAVPLGLIGLLIRLIANVRLLSSEYAAPREGAEN